MRRATTGSTIIKSTNQTTRACSNLFSSLPSHHHHVCHYHNSHKSLMLDHHFTINNNINNNKINQPKYALFNSRLNHQYHHNNLQQQLHAEKQEEEAHKKVNVDRHVQDEFMHQFIWSHCDFLIREAHTILTLTTPSTTTITTTTALHTNDDDDNDNTMMGKKIARGSNCVTAAFNHRDHHHGQKSGMSNDLLIASSSSAIMIPQFTDRFQMLFSVIDCVIRLASWNERQVLNMSHSLLFDNDDKNDNDDDDEKKRKIKSSHGSHYGWFKDYENLFCHVAKGDVFYDDSLLLGKDISSSTAVSDDAISRDQIPRDKQQLMFQRFMRRQLNHAMNNGLGSGGGWKKEIQRMYKLRGPSVMAHLKQQFQMVIQVLSRMETAVPSYCHETQQVVYLDARIVAAFVELILESEVFANHGAIIEKCDRLMSLIKEVKKNERHGAAKRVVDYYLIERLSVALKREREISDRLDELSPMLDAQGENDVVDDVLKGKMEDLTNLVQSYIHQEPIIPLYYSLRRVLTLQMSWNTEQQAKQMKKDCDTLIDRLGQKGDVDAYIDRAIALAEMKRYDEAERDCLTALSLNPVLPDVYFYLVSFDLIRGHFINGLLLVNEAIFALQHLLHNRPGYIEMLEEFKTECLSICKEGIKNRSLYEIILNLIECRVLLVTTPIVDSEQFCHLFERLIDHCRVKIMSQFPNNIELVCAVHMLNVMYEVQVLRKTTDVFHKLMHIQSLMPNHPGVQHFIGVTYFHAYGCLVDNEEYYAEAYMLLEQSSNSFNKALSLSQNQPVKKYRFTPYRTMSSLAAVTAYMEQENDAYRIRVCTDALEKLKDQPNNLAVSKLLTYRSSFAEHGGLYMEALKDLDKILVYNPFNVNALRRRRDLLNRLNIRPEIAQEDDRLISILVQESNAIIE